MSNDTGKWLPMNLDGSFHACKKVEVKAKDNNKQEPIVIINQEPKKKEEDNPEAKAWVREIMEGPKIKELEERLKRIEEVLFLAGAKK